MMLLPTPCHAALSPMLRHPFDLLHQLERQALDFDSEETDDAYCLTLPVPGVRPADVEIMVHDGALLLAAKRSRGAFERRLRLPRDANVSASTATLEDGLLTVVVPKQEATQLTVVSGEAPETGSEKNAETESEKNTYAIRIDVPGIRTADLHVVVQGTDLAVSGKSLRAGHKYSVKRRFELPADADTRAASATHMDGVLTLAVPKLVAPEAKRLKIGTATLLPTTPETEDAAVAAAEEEFAREAKDGEAAEDVQMEQ